MKFVRTSQKKGSGIPTAKCWFRLLLNAVVLMGYMNFSWQKAEYNGSLSKSGICFAVAFFLLAYLVMKSNFHTNHKGLEAKGGGIA